MKGLLWLMLLLVPTSVLYSQETQVVKLRLENYPDTALILASYYGNRIEVMDTAYKTKRQNFYFKRSGGFPKGVYMVANFKRQKLFEFVISQKTSFLLETKGPDFTGNMQVSKSLENQMFFQFINKNNRLYKILKNLKKELKNPTLSSEKKAQIKKKIISVNMDIRNFKALIEQKYPNLFLTKLLKASDEIKIPEGHSHDTLYRFRYLKAHYWDNFNLGNKGLFRTPLYAMKVSRYFKYYVPMIPDSVIQSIGLVMRKAKPCQECFSFLAWKFISDYQNPKYMGFDKVFVNLVDKYFMKEPVLNATPSIKKMLKERADKLRPTLMGNVAPDLILIDPSGQYVDFKSLKAQFTLLVFWDYHCGICKKELAELKEMIPYLHKKYDLRVYAISINPDISNWKKALKERSYPWINVNGTHSIKGDFTKTYDIPGTPQLYLLNKKKVIIAKKFSINQLKAILNHYLKEKINNN